MTDQKSPPRLRDKNASLRKLLSDPRCRACYAVATNCHHLVGRGQQGDDVPDNLIPLCGSGSSGCHGALHGTPYVVGGERRDGRWVRERIGLRLTRHEYVYVIAKLAIGDDVRPGVEHLRRFYHAEAAASGSFFRMRAA